MSLYKFSQEVTRPPRLVFRDFKDYGSLESHDFIRIHESDLAALLHAAKRSSEIAMIQN